MGYYTNYQLSWTKQKGIKEEDYIEEISKISGQLFEDHLNNSCRVYDATWYDCKKDMLKLSSKFPETLFTLKGEGEDSGDIWVKYYKEGKLKGEDKLEVKLKTLEEIKNSSVKSKDNH